MRFPELLAVVAAAVTLTATTAAAQLRGPWDVELGGGWNVQTATGDISDFRDGPTVDFGATQWAGDWGIGVKGSAGLLPPRRDRKYEYDEYYGLFAFLVFRYRFTCSGECIFTGSITGAALGVPVYYMPIPGMLLDVSRRVRPGGWKLTATDDVKLYVGVRLTGLHYHFLVTPAFSISW